MDKMRETALALGLHECSLTSVLNVSSDLDMEIDEPVHRVFARRIGGQMVVLIQSEDQFTEGDFSLFAVKVEDRGINSPFHRVCFFEIHPTSMIQI